MIDTQPLHHYIRQHMARHKTPGLALALTDRSETLHLATFGYSDLEAGTSLAEADLFEIGSIGKTFTAIALLQAVERGELDLHSPVTDYLPWFRIKNRYSPITIHHLLTHTSGLIEGTDFTPDGRGEVWALRQTETGSPPGERFHYSNVGYKVLGLVLEAATGRPYPEGLWAGIFEPLGMGDSLAEITHHDWPRMAKGYRPLYDDRPFHPSQPLYPASWLETNTSDGSVASSASDMAKFARMLLNAGKVEGRPVISTSSFELMTTRHIPQDEVWYYGYGLDIFTREGYAHTGHAGDMPGYEAFMWLDMDNSLACVMLATHPHPPGISLPILDYLRASRLGETPAELPAPPDPFRLVEADPAVYAGLFKKVDSVSPAIQSGRVGAWHSPGGLPSTLLFKSSRDSLSLEYSDTLIPLEPRGKDKFFTSHPDFDRFFFQFGYMDAGNANQQADELYWGPDWFVRDTYKGALMFDIQPAWEAFCGHYRSHNPWESNFRVFERKGQLILAWPSGKEEPLHPFGDSSFRIGEQGSPERISFDQIAAGQALRARRSCCDYFRFFTP